MQLCQFTITDGYNIPEIQIISEAKEIAAERAKLEGWKDYTVSQYKDPLQSGVDKIYYFEVEGDLFDISELEQSNNTIPPVPIKDDKAASPAAI